jgi:hypothetical protein
MFFPTFWIDISRDLAGVPFVVFAKILPDMLLKDVASHNLLCDKVDRCAEWLKSRKKTNDKQEGRSHA